MSNTVDYLKSQINDIQSKCLHRWIITSTHDELRESFIPGIYLGKEGIYVPGNTKFAIACSECSLVDIRHYTDTCPRCFQTLKAETNTEFRDKYKVDIFGKFGDFVVRVYNCPSKDFAVANDEFYS